jgi:V/A-type H+-transporting ATPase subunit D
MSTPGPAVPPGRAGRLWLQRRLETARRGAELLDRKLRILQAQLDRARESAAQSAAEWRRSQAEAESWLLRAALLGGQRAIRLADDGLFADVTVSYAATVGIRYPAGATCVIPPTAAWDGPALAGARQAHRAALAVAVRHAAAAEAERVIEAEALATRHRLRAIRDRWIPRLEHALAEVTFAIEEQEQADAARLRLAASTPSPASPAAQARHLPTGAEGTGDR